MDDIQKSDEAIMDWKQHILRTVHQDHGRTSVFENLLEPNTSLYLHCDFAMKWLQQEHREGQSAFFGKRGMPWHIIVAVRKIEDGSFETINIVHVFDHALQDGATVVALLKDSIQELKKAMPSLQTVFVRSDNAGCYHGTGTLLSLRSIAHETGVKISRYDFSESQSGKGCCDRVAAQVKQHLRRYLAEGNDVVNSAQFLEGCRTVPSTALRRGSISLHPEASAKTRKLQLTGISKFSNFEFSETGITAWRAHNIGAGTEYEWDVLNPNCYSFESIFLLLPGSLMSLENLSWRSVGKRFGTRATEVEATHSQDSGPDEEKFNNEENEEIFGATDILPSSVAGTCESVDQTASLTPCPEDGCVAMFAHEANLLKHVVIGKHRYELQRETLNDFSKQEYHSMLQHSLFAEGIHAVIGQLQISGDVESESTCVCGWALKEVRSVQFSKEQRSFMSKLWLEGEDSGLKADANEVEQKMKTDRLSSGQKRFKRTRWLSSQQIKSFWSNLTNAKAKKHISAAVEVLDETAAPADFDEREAEMDAAAAETEVLITECCNTAAVVCPAPELEDASSETQTYKDDQNGRQANVTEQPMKRKTQRRQARPQQQSKESGEDDNSSPETRTPDAKRLPFRQRSSSTSSDDEPLAGAPWCSLQEFSLETSLNF